MESNYSQDSIKITFDLQENMPSSTAISTDTITPPSQEQILELETRFLLYTVCGSVVLFCSALTIIVFTFTKEFRTKYALFNALAVADFINGLSFVMAGYYRGQYLLNGSYYHPITNSECIWETPWAVLMIVAGQLPALLNLSLSLERVVALEFGSWYRRIWQEYHKHYIVVVCYGLTLLSLGSVLLMDKYYTVTNSNRMCAVMNSTGIIYGTVHFSVCALTFLACFIILLVIFRKTNRNKKPTTAERKRQLLLQSITGISVVLVSCPNLVLILNEWKLPEINDLVVGIAYCLYALHSSLSLPIYLYFKQDFRRRFMKIFFRVEAETPDHSRPTPSFSITLPNGRTIFIKRQKSST